MEKLQEIKVLWKFAKIIWVTGFIIWFVETLIFLIIEGWHWKATHPIEIFLDSVVSNSWNVALLVTIYVAGLSLFYINEKR